MLGAAEAGFFPGIILYLTWWFPEQERTRALALFLTAISVAYVAAGRSPAGCSSSTASSASTAGSGCSCARGCRRSASASSRCASSTRGPRRPNGSSRRSATSSIRELARERAVMEEAPGAGRIGEALVNGQVWLLGLIYFILLAAGFGLTFFVPDLVQDRTGYSDFEVGVLAAVPFGIATVAMLVVARRAERAAEPQALHRRTRARSARRHRSHGARAVAGPAHGRHLPRGDRAPRRHPGLLGAAHGVPERLGRRGGHRADRGARQPRRVRRAGVHRDLRGLHGRLRDAADRARRPARGGRACWCTRRARAASPTLRGPGRRTD